VCYNAHLYVDNLKNIGDVLWEVVKENSLYLGVIAAVLALAAFAGIGAAVAYLTVSGIVAIIAGSATIATFSDTKDDLEAAREDIVCALIIGGDLAGAVEAALGSGPAWDLFYRWVPYDTAMAIIHEGGHDGEFLPAETRDDCVCDEEIEFIENWQWNADVDDPWRMVNDAFWASGAIVMGGNAELHAWAGEMRIYLGLGSTGTLTIHRLKFGYKRSTTNGGPRVKISHDGGDWEWVYDDTPANTYYQKEFFFDPPLVVTHPTNPFIRFDESHSGNIVRNYYVELDMDAS
jgi:hypothetical protein